MSFSFKVRKLHPALENAVVVPIVESNPALAASIVPMYQRTRGPVMPFYEDVEKQKVGRATQVC